MTVPRTRSRRNPRSARRTRKPMKDNWTKAPKAKMLKCTYEKCGYEWQYYGGRNWAECPACHSTMKVAIAHRNFRLADKE